MRKILILFIAVTIISKAHSQNVGIGTNTPNVSAQLDVNSTTKGFLPPRMDSTQRNAIISPVAGLVIYNTTTKGFECYNGTKWYGTVHFIGENYGGGIVYFIYDGGQHGLIASTSDQSSGIRWNGGSNTNSRARADGMRAGLSNTSIIISNQGSVDGNAFAATICNEYSVTVGGVTYGDWYLPSKYELNLLYQQRDVVGGFASEYYWSSTEFNNSGAWCHFFAFAQLPTVYIKNSQGPVRAIRAF